MASLLPPIALTGCLAWFVASSLWIYPHSLSYFNESIGGPLNGPEYLLGSNVDWGQDLRYLRNWMLPASAKNYSLYYFGLFNPQHIGISCGNTFSCGRWRYCQ